LAHVPFYAKQSLTLGDGPDALGKLPLLTRERMRASLPKAWLPDGRDAKAELASGKIAVIEMGAGAARARFLFDAAWWRAQERRGSVLSLRARAARRGARAAARRARIRRAHACARDVGASRGDRAGLPGLGARRVRHARDRRALRRR